MVEKINNISIAFWSDTENEISIRSWFKIFDDGNFYLLNMSRSIRDIRLVDKHLRNYAISNSRKSSLNKDNYNRIQYNNRKVWSVVGYRWVSEPDYHPKNILFWILGFLNGIMIDCYLKMGLTIKSEWYFSENLLLDIL